MGRWWHGLLRRRLFNRIHERISRSLFMEQFFDSTFKKVIRTYNLTLILKILDYRKKHHGRTTYCEIAVSIHSAKFRTCHLAKFSAMAETLDCQLTRN